MIAVGTNLLIYAHRTDAVFHQPARTALEGLALCPYHGVTERWSAGRDFSRFPALAVRNPLMA